MGTISHLYGALTLTALSDEFDDADIGTVFGLTAYSYLSGFACLAGAIGVLKVNRKKKKKKMRSIVYEQWMIKLIIE